MTIPAAAKACKDLIKCFCKAVRCGTQASASKLTYCVLIFVLVIILVIVIIPKKCYTISYIL